MNGSIRDSSDRRPIRSGVRGEIKASGEFFQNRGDAGKTHRLFNFLGYADYIINRCYPEAQKIKTFTRDWRGQVYVITSRQSRVTSWTITSQT